MNARHTHRLGALLYYIAFLPWSPTPLPTQQGVTHQTAINRRPPASRPRRTRCAAAEAWQARAWAGGGLPKRAPTGGPAPGRWCPQWTEAGGHGPPTKARRVRSAEAWLG